jgi:hypothetical protein
MNISGGGAVDGTPNDLTSYRGELQGQTALAIMAQQLQQITDANDVTFHMYGDNLAVQNKCKNISTSKIKHHREPNMDLLMEYKAATENLQVTTHWVQSHQDKDTPWYDFSELKDLRLPMDATVNVWCDKLAEQNQLKDTSFPAISVLPSEKWALFTNIPLPHKIIGRLENIIHQTLYHEAAQAYIEKKHGLTAAKMKDVQTANLHKYLSHIRPHERANVVKLIHRWAPTYDLLHKQGRHPMPTCPRCKTNNETAMHLFCCSHKSAEDDRQEALQKFVDTLQDANGPAPVIQTFIDKLSDTLHITQKIPVVQKTTKEFTPIQERAMQKAVQHQNVIGWENLLRGYVSQFWTHIYYQEDKRPKKCPWHDRITEAALLLHKTLWRKCNEAIHGITIAEQKQRAREAVQQRVRDIYRENPKLAPRYAAIYELSLERRLNKTISKVCMQK